MKKIIEKLDSKLIRLGSSLLGVTTSDYDYAVSESVWRKLYPMLESKLLFSELGCGSGHPTNYCSTNGKYPMHNIDNVKMVCASTEFDFIIYKDSDILAVRNAVKKFTQLIKSSPQTASCMRTDKLMRIEIFQSFLNVEFNVTLSTDTDLDELFADL